MPRPRPGKGPGESYLAQHPHAPLVWAWRRRWQLAPVAVAGTAVVGAVTAPWAVGCGLAGVGGLMAAAAVPAWQPRLGAFAGRRWLSVRERRSAAAGLAGAAAWVGVAQLLQVTAVVDAVLLAAVLGWPAQQWWTSRVARGGRLSPSAAAMVARWAVDVAAGKQSGLKALRGAVVVPGSVTEPVEGGVAMVVRLDGVHAADATSGALRRSVEVAMGLPADTVTLSPLRDDGPADRLQVLMAPIRHLEKAATVWPGPVIGADGSLPVALAEAGEQVAIHVWNKDGVEHGLISGTSGSGKGGSTVVVIAPCVLAGRSVVLYADGKHGMSAPELHPLATRLATSTKQAGQAIDVAHAVMCAREIRYGAAKLKRFMVTGPDANEDPIVTLLLDEASTLNRVLPTSKIKKVMEIAERGRACGVQLIQVTQSVRSDMVIGGVTVRDLLTGAGFSIAHKPGGSSAARLATDGIEVAGLAEALKTLPGGQPGMAVITRRGEVLSTRARVFDAEADALALVEQWLADGNQPRELTGADLAAAGAAYTTGWDDDDSDSAGSAGPAAGGAPAPAGDTTDSGQDAAGIEQSWVWAQLDAAGIGGVKVKALEDLAKADPAAPGRATIYRHLNGLLADGHATNTGGTWRLAGLPDQDDELDQDDEPDQDNELDEPDQPDQPDQDDEGDVELDQGDDELDQGDPGSNLIPFPRRR